MERPSILFSREGLIVAALILIIEYNLYTLIWAYSGFPGDSIPDKYLLNVTILLAVLIVLYIVFRGRNLSELQTQLVARKDIQSDALTAISLSIFTWGTFIVYNLVRAKVYNSQTIYEFVNSNEHIQHASEPIHIINQVLYPLVSVFVFQGFLLNGLAKEVGYRKATLVSSLVSGFWFGDLVGGTVFSLFMNELYWKTRNIFYPAIVSATLNLIFIPLYFFNPAFWVLQATAPDYNREAVKGLVLAFSMTPVAWLVVKRTVKTIRSESSTPRESTNSATE